MPILVEGSFTRTKVVIDQSAFENNEDEVQLL